MADVDWRSDQAASTCTVAGGRVGAHGGHDTFTPIRFMIAHCWAIESVLFQLQ